MEINKLVNEIIPPADYQHRNGFNNTPLIDKLTVGEKKQLEDALIHKLLFESEQEVDTLIIETLAYLKSHKSLPILMNVFAKCKDEAVKLKIASIIFEIDQDPDMIDAAINIFNVLEADKSPYHVHILSSAFYYLAKFKNAKINHMIEKYAESPEYLIAYNAKRALKIA